MSGALTWQLAQHNNKVAKLARIRLASTVLIPDHEMVTENSPHKYDTLSEAARLKAILMKLTSLGPRFNLTNVSLIVTLGNAHERNQPFTRSVWPINLKSLTCLSKLIRDLWSEATIGRQSQPPKLNTTQKLVLLHGWGGGKRAQTPARSNTLSGLRTEAIGAGQGALACLMTWHISPVRPAATICLRAAADERHRLFAR